MKKVNPGTQKQMEDQIQHAVVLGAMLAAGMPNLNSLNDKMYEMFKSHLSDSVSYLGFYEPFNELDLARTKNMDELATVLRSLKTSLTVKIRSHTTPRIADWFDFSTNVTLVSTNPETIDEFYKELEEQAKRIELTGSDFKELISHMRQKKGKIFDTLMKYASLDAARKSIFISYSHKNSETAKLIMNQLSGVGFRVIIDFQQVIAGQKFTHFIREGISSADVTLLLVSRDSLLSTYVGMEVIHSFYNELYSGKKFIAGFLDDSFFASSFRIEATKELDESIMEIDNLITQAKKLKIDTIDLDHRKKRLFDLRNHLGEILSRLNEAYCIDLRNEAFSNGIERIIDSIRHK